MNNYRLFELIAQLNTALNYDDIQKVCAAFCHYYGFDNFIYAARIPTSLISPDYISINGYPQEWREHYVEQDYLRIDPTVSHCFSKTTPVYWEHIVKTECKENKIVDQLFSEARGLGLRNGISYPIHCIHGETAMFSISMNQTVNQSRDHIQDTLAIGHLFASYVHEAIVNVPDNDLLARVNAQLTPREKECLLWTTDGKTSWEISQILNIAERTVVFHLGNAMKKLNVVNKQHAVARAISLGHIRPAI